MIYTHNDSFPKERLIDFEKPLLKLSNRYGLFAEGKWKYLCQIGGCELEGRCTEYWQDIVEGATGHWTSNPNAQWGTFVKLIQWFYEKCLVKHGLDIQKDAMETGEMRYEGHHHEKVAKWLFQINTDLKLLFQDAENFLICDMARKVFQETVLFSLD